MASRFAQSRFYSSRKQRGSGRGRRVASVLPIVEMLDFKWGLINYLEPQQIPRGAAADELNFLARGTKIETRNGYTPLGTEIAGAGQSQGTYTAHKWDGTEIIYRARAGKLEYDSDGNGTWVEVGTNLLAGAAVTEMISMSEYISPAGAQLWVSSPNSVLVKIMTANPGSYVDHYNASRNFKGNIKIRANRMLMWNWLGNTLGKASNSHIRGSFIDKQSYTTTSAEAVGTGDGATKVFTGTLAVLSGTKKTAFGVTFTDTVETFSDNFDGTLTGSLGGTGTINYATGVYSITFNTAPVNLQAITTTYQTEDATAGGVADFTQSGTRVPGEGFTQQQSFGGKLLDVFHLNGTEYCLHERAAWALTLAADDSSATNIIYRERMALAAARGGVATADGIYYVDSTNKSKPYVAMLTYDNFSGLVLPKDLSSQILDLSGFNFDQCVAWEWEKYILFACRTTDSTKNNRILLYNKDLHCFDIVDFYANSFAIRGGALFAGDSSTVNVYNLFSGFDDNGSIPNYSWTSSIDDLGIGGLKKTRELWFEGNIATNQSVDIYAAIDRGTFVKIGTISGNGSYVDRGQAVTVGSLIMGRNVVGGGSNGATAFHYLMKITFAQGKFKYRQLKLLPTGIGYFSATMITDFDVRGKEDKLPIKYRS